MAACTTSRSRWRTLIAGGAVSLILLGGCASTGNPSDPFEPVNRAIYKFNDGVDGLLIKPAAEFYRFAVPSFVRTGVGNFFSNINDVIAALNNLLQGKIPEAMNDLGRILVNTTLGVFGVLDPATSSAWKSTTRTSARRSASGDWATGHTSYYRSLTPAACATPSAGSGTPTRGRFPTSSPTAIAMP